ncbi:terminase gpP N-terminus-related DNA-binding protein [Cyclobacterium marinum]|uniref:terminase gpP N-terminus-related DNA-binding protein n=1 Tax=Cyclobacterium marinum TaxID=104 RepID=UPI0030D7A0FD|tara:strand:+ start:32703 stop:33140 length:438 start_codon:yes stop_codon:yes gene_type:complete
MANPIPLKKRKILAESYFFNFYSQKEIADLLDTPENTISRWVQAGDWKKIRDHKTVTRDKLVSNLLSQVNQLEEAAREENRPLNSKETDSILKIAMAVEKLDKKINLSLYIQVFKEFNDFLIREDFDLAKRFIPYQSNFIRNHAE